jgi:ribosomal protein L13E
MENDNINDLGAFDHEDWPDQQPENEKQKPGPKPKEMVEGTFMGLPVGRDKKVIDPQDVEKLAALGCKDREIARFLGIHHDTLRRNFEQQLDVGREQLKITLRRAMLDNACKNMNAAVQIFLAKNLLGMSDTPTDTEDTKPLPWDSVE